MLKRNFTESEKVERNKINREILDLQVHSTIRNSFDKSRTTLEAESWIAIARERGLCMLADAMEIDLQNELLTA